MLNEKENIRGDSKSGRMRGPCHDPAKSYPRMRSHVRIYPMDTAFQEQQYIIELESGKKFRVPGSCYHMLSLMDGRRSDHEIARELSSSSGGNITGEDVRSIIERFVAPLGIIEDGGVGGRDRMSTGRRSIFYFKKPLLSFDQLSGVTGFLSRLFLKPLIIPLVILIVSTHLILYLSPAFRHTLSLPLTGEGYLIVILIFLLSVAAHELGHASACRHAGITHGPLGFALYLVFPVFYADVSEAWHLPRKGRILIDLAGIYFQLLFTVGLLIAYIATSRQAYLISIAAIDMVIILNLMPFLRYDGYWVFCDMSGIPNLRSQSIKLAMDRLHAIMFPGTKSRYPAITRKAAVYLHVYLLASMAFFVCMIWLLPPLLSGIMAEYPVLLEDTVRHGGKLFDKGEYADILLHCYRLVFLTLVLAGLGCMFLRAVSSFLTMSRRALNRHMERDQRNRSLSQKAPEKGGIRCTEN